MPSRYYLRNFVVGNYYHLYNRGAHKADIFRDDMDYHLFIDIIKYYLQFPKGKPISYYDKLIDNNIFQVTNLEDRLKEEIRSSFSINCFILVPNHFHLLVKQETEPTQENGISNFMRRVMITYAMEFNRKYDHSGSLLQGRYKNVVVEDDNQLIYLTKYIHNNAKTLLKKDQKLSDYRYSSYSDFLGSERYPWLYKEEILSLVSDKNPSLSYKAFVEESPLETDFIENVKID